MHFTYNASRKTIFMILSVALAVGLELVVLLFTNNKMYNPEGQVVRMFVPNLLRILLFGSCIFYALLNTATVKCTISNVKSIVAERKHGIRLFFVIFGIAFIAINLILLIIKGGYNRYHLIFAFFTSVIIALFFLYGKKQIISIERLFFSTYLMLIIMIVFSMPMFTYGGDTKHHFEESLKMAQEYNGCNYAHYVDYIDANNNTTVEKVNEVISEANDEPIYDYKVFEPLFIKKIRDIAYIPFASALVLADAVNASPFSAFVFGEIVNAVFCGLLYYKAIKRLKSGKMILILFVLCPRMISLHAVYSYTPWVIAWMTYASARIIGDIQSGIEIDLQEVLNICMAYTVGILTKQPYLFMLLFVLLIPLAQYKNTKEFRKSILAVFCFMLFIFSTLILAGLFSDKGFQIYSDTRGGAEVNAVKQAFYILEHPLIYGKTLLGEIYELLSPTVFFLGRDGFTVIRTHTTCILSSVFVLLFIVCILTDYKDEKILSKYLNAKARAKVFGITMLGICIIITIMYMNYTEVGALDIKGATPFYLQAFMFPFFYYCSSGIISVSCNWRKYNTYIMGIYTILILINIFLKITNSYI